MKLQNLACVGVNWLGRRRLSAGYSFKEKSIEIMRA